jgi:hypothetical protein
MDITGARWGLAGAEAILKLRAIKANDDFDEYWRYHLAQEHHHVHQTRYHDQLVPEVGMTGHLRGAAPMSRRARHLGALFVSPARNRAVMVVRCRVP